MKNTTNSLHRSRFSIIITSMHIKGVPLYDSSVLSCEIKPIRVKAIKLETILLLQSVFSALSQGLEDEILESSIGS